MLVEPSGTVNRPPGLARTRYSEAVEGPGSADHSALVMERWRERAVRRVVVGDTLGIAAAPGLGVTLGELAQVVRIKRFEPSSRLGSGGCQALRTKPNSLPSGSAIVNLRVP
jgi:hypothetical protein